MACLGLSVKIGRKTFPLNWVSVIFQYHVWKPSWLVCATFSSGKLSGRSRVLARRQQFYLPVPSEAPSSWLAAKMNSCIDGCASDIAAQPIEGLTGWWKRRSCERWHHDVSPGVCARLCVYMHACVWKLKECVLGSCRWSREAESVNSPQLQSPCCYSIRSVRLPLQADLDPD